MSAGTEHPRGVLSGMDDVLVTGKLARRAARAPDFKAENRALTALASVMATSPGTLLQVLADTVLDLCRADSAGISILEAGGETGAFRWHAVAGAFAHTAGDTMPREASPCGAVLTTDSVLLLDRPERRFPALQGIAPPIFENLLTPFHVDGEPVGTVWAMAHSPERTFDAEDARVLASLARFASAAYQMAAARDAAELGVRVLAAQAEERAEAERTRREEETRFRSALEIKTVGVLFFDHAGAITNANGAFLRMGGYSREDLAAGRLRWDELTPPEWVPASLRANEEIRTGGSSTPYEKEYYRKDGSRWCGLFAAKALGERGGVEFVIDITETKRAEAALRESDARLARLLATTPAGVVELDADGCFAYANAAAEGILGAGPGGLVGRRHDDPAWRATAGDGALLAPERLPAAWALRGEEVRDYELAVATLDDRRAVLLMDAAPVRDGAGGIEGALMAFQDVTARHAATEALREGEARLRLALDAGGLGDFEWDLRADVVRPSARAREIFAFAPGEGGRSADYFARILPEDLPRARAEVEGGLAAGQVAIGYRARLPDGTIRHVLSQGVVVRGLDGAPSRLIGVFADETERRRAEAALRQSNETLEARVAERTAALTQAVDALHAEALERTQAEAALRQSQKMEAVGQLTGGIAHDFNNMLQGISGSLELMRRRVAQGRADEAARFVEGARATVERAAALTNRLLAFARRQALQPRLVDPNELIRGMAELIRRTVGPSVAVELRLGDGAWSVLCDPSQLENVLLNLAINARDAMPEGGRLAIATADTHLTRADIAGQDGAKPGDYVTISVADTGTGMDEATVARAFEPFFTTKPAGQGTGLGLSQIYGFVRQSGGIVRLDSAPGRGTTVCLHLPRHEQARSTEAAKPVDAAEAPQAGAGRTVLLVEDEAQVRGVAAETLRDLGYHVLEAGDGSAALRVLHGSLGSRVDLLVTDVGLPGGLNGRQVAEAARERRPGLPVLLITGYAGDALKKQLAPGMEVLAKPFALAVLASRVRGLIEPALVVAPR